MMTIGYLRRWRRLFPLILVLSLLAAACAGGEDATETTAADASDQTTTGELPTIIVQHVPADPSAIPLVVMKEHQIDEAHGFSAELLEVDFDVSTSVFVLGESDISVEQDIVTMAIDRNEGHEVVTWWPGLNFITSVIVQEDSPYQSLEDLRGEQVGHYGVESGGTTTISLTASEFYGMDIFEEFELVEAAPSALPELLSIGEVEAIFLYEPLGTTAILQAPGRYLLEPTKVWLEERGWAPWLTNLASREVWLQENEDLAFAFRDAWDEALDMIEESNYEILREDFMADFLAFGSEEELEQFITYSQDLPLFARDWSDEQIQAANDYIELLVDNNLLIEQVPEGPVAVQLEEYFGS